MFMFSCFDPFAGLGCPQADGQRLGFVQPDFHAFIKVLFLDKIRPKPFVQLFHVLDLSLGNWEDLIILINLNSETLHLAGVGAILVAVGGALRAAFDGDPSTNIDIASTIAAVTAGIGLIMAKDAKDAVEVPKP